MVAHHEDIGLGSLRGRHDLLYRIAQANLEVRAGQCDAGPQPSGADGWDSRGQLHRLLVTPPLDGYRPQLGSYRTAHV
jgi:hypothetical protein